MYNAYCALVKAGTLTTAITNKQVDVYIAPIAQLEEPGMFYRIGSSCSQWKRPIELLKHVTFPTVVDSDTRV